MIKRASKRKKPLDRSNRASAEDRPATKSKCRNGDPLVKRCQVLGHEFMFYRGDRYGWCRHCGAEVLT